MSDKWLEFKITVAIKLGLQVYKSDSYAVWANDWLSGKDRSSKSAYAAAAAADAAAAAYAAAAYAAATAAYSAAYAADAAAYAADAAAADRSISYSLKAGANLDLVVKIL